MVYRYYNGIFLIVHRRYKRSFVEHIQKIDNFVFGYSFEKKFFKFPIVFRDLRHGVVILSLQCCYSVAQHSNDTQTTLQRY